MKTEITEKLDAIVGKEVNYKGKNITIEKWKLVNGVNIVIYTPSPLNFLESEITEFLESLYEPITKEKKVTEVLVPKNELVHFESTSDNKIIKESLMDALQKVKDNPEYINQAKSVCEIVNSMVNIQKNEIQMLSIINKYKV